MDKVIDFIGLILICATTAAIVTTFISWLIYKGVSK